MALAIQKGLLNAFIQSMYEEGIVNDQFYQVQAMKDTIRPDYVMRAVASYCVAAQNIFSQLTIIIEQPEVDFLQLDVYARDLYSKSSSMGAEHVKVACAELLRASQDKDKDYCSRVLYWTKNEYSQLRRKFETLLQESQWELDKSIVFVASKHNHGLETSFGYSWSYLIRWLKKLDNRWKGKLLTSKVDVERKPEAVNKRVPPDILS